MKNPHTKLSATLRLWTIAAAIGFSTMPAQSGSPGSETPNTTIVYFLRHGEDVPELVGSDPSFTVTFNNCNEEETCCVENLNPLGRVRATALADWFEARKITRTLTHVIASHKARTRQTVEKIAHAAGLGGDLNGDGIPDGADVDQAPGDGVINVPSTPAECDPGWTASSSVTQPQINYVAALPVGSRAVLCSHSPVLYPVMQAFGIDTSDSVKFPRDSRGRVRGFDNLWVVELTPAQSGSALAYRGRVIEHLLLDFELGVSLIHRDHGNGHGRGSRSDEN